MIGDIANAEHKSFRVTCDPAIVMHESQQKDCLR
jgi:hypothetical protein